MLPAWNMLNTVDPVRLVDALGNVTETLPIWEVRDSSMVVSRWMAQFLPVADLLATAFGVAKEHWLRPEVELSIQQVDTLMKSDPRVGQALFSIWIVSTVSITFLVIQTLIATARLFGRCMRRVVRAVCPARAATIEAAAEMVLPDGAGPTPKVDLAGVTYALGENTRINITAEDGTSSEKKVDRRRLESPVARVTKARMQARKEDVPPSVASPLRRKQSELNDIREQGLVGRRLRGN